MDGHAAYPPAVNDLRKEGWLGNRCRARQVTYLNNILEQDHRRIKRRVAAKHGFRSINGARNTIAGYEAVDKIRKGQIRWLAKDDIIGQIAFTRRMLGLQA